MSSSSSSGSGSRRASTVMAVCLSLSLSLSLCQSVCRSVPALHWPVCIAVSCRLSTVSCLLCGSLPQPLSPRHATDPPLPACSLYKSHIHCVFLSRFFKRAVIFLCADSRTPLPTTFPLAPFPFRPVTVSRLARLDA